jgi:two-component system phosphate regulon sensor histidine kinase PhoR
MNPAAEKLLKVVPGGWQGATLEAINRIDALTAIASEPPDPEEEQELHLSEDQTLQPSVVDVPNVGRLILLHDISALKALDKMKSEFVLTFTHDLAAPLAAIKGYLELMRIDGALTERQEEDLDSIRMSVDQMRNLITDLQELSRLETLKNMVRRNISLNDTLQKTVDTFQPIAETKAIRLILNPSDESLVTYGNPALIARAVDNLVENAIKYTRAQGQVGVSLSGDHGEVLIIVKDTGIGIPTKKLSNIFEKFFRAHPPSENEIPGSGLGLSIVKTIVERHGGRIWVESEVDVGSTFTIALPRHQNGSVG